MLFFYDNIVLVDQTLVDINIEGHDRWFWYLKYFSY